MQCRTTVVWVLAAVGILLLLVGCRGDPDEPVEPTPTAAPEPDPGREPDPDPAVEPVQGDPGTEERHEDPQRGAVALVDVRFGIHEGFDRVTLDFEGDGAPGWIVGYQDDARTAGKGAVVELDGQVVLNVALQGMTIPPDLPEGIEPAINERWPGPEGGLAREVVSDTVFEAVQAVFIGLDREYPFVIARLEDPTRVVVDIFRDFRLAGY